MGRLIAKILAWLAILLGLALLIQPTAAQWWTSTRNAKTAAQFAARAEAQPTAPAAEETTADPPEPERAYPELYAAMQDYNVEIYAGGQSGLTDPFAYEEAPLDLAAYGYDDDVLAVLWIPRLNLELPVYLGASRENLAKGAALLGQTSMPLGGENTNTVIAAHRGYYGAEMLRNVQQIQVGDKIQLTTPWETLIYRVSELKIIDPSDINAVLIQPGRDLLTLSTCHPYTRNSQRYLVIAEHDTAAADTTKEEDLQESAATWDETPRQVTVEDAGGSSIAEVAPQALTPLPGEGSAESEGERDLQYHDLAGKQRTVGRAGGYCRRRWHYGDMEKTPGGLTMQYTQQAAAVTAEVNKAVQGKQQTVNTIWMAMLAGGHVLIEDIPGVGKTTLALAFARALDLKESRVQFTPDVLPSDLVGFSVYQKETGKFVYHAGAVMCNLFLGDEINRTSSRTQSALLEVMEEGTVTVDGVTRPVPAPFTVIATQNPIGAAGTQMLPQSQLDRFMVCAVMGYPDEEAELAILAGQSKGRLLDRVRPVAGQADLLAMQQEVSTVFVHELMYRYIVALAQASRKDPRLAVGLSPRATLALASMTRAAAYLAGRDFVAPQDVTAVFDAVARHRLVLNDQARAGGETVDSVMQDLLRTVPRPRPEKADRHGR
ncbi:MAG: class C sortase [Subdoligranulum sp.]